MNSNIQKYCRLYLRKKSFFERFFAHKTGKDTKNILMTREQLHTNQTFATASQKTSNISDNNLAKWTQY